jgi:hypothetical protein
MLNTFIQKSMTVIDHAKDLNQAVQMSRFLGEILWKNSVGHYELIDLENLLVNKYIKQFNVEVKSVQRYPYLHVLTKAYDTGGHTRIVDRLIHSETMQESAVLVTESTGPNTLKKLSAAKHGLTQIGKLRDSRAKIQAIIDALAHCETVVLHLHPHDIETVIAVAIAKRHFGIQVLMYNHADHVFSFGYAVADRVLEISYFGWALRHVRKSEKKSLFVGIPLKLPDLSIHTKPRIDDGYLTAAGSAYKFKPGQGFSFPDFLQQMTKKIDIPFILIGPQPLRNWWWWRVFVKTMFDATSKVKFAPKMPHEEYLRYLQNATAFIDSFPMTGGTAFPEILSLGVPCFGVLTGAHGYTPADQLKSASVALLSEDLTRFLESGFRHNIKLEDIVDQLYAAHDTEKVASRMTKAMENDLSNMRPIWKNPAEVDARFYEKIWQEKKIFSMPLHTLPNIRLFFLFIAYWWNKNRTA